MKYNRILLPAIVILFIAIGCSRNTDKTTENSGIDYSDELITDEEIRTFFSKFDADTSIKRQVTEFYHNRDNRIAWFDDNKLISSAENFYNKLSEHTIIMEDTSFVYKQLREQWKYKDMRKRKKPKDANLNLELLLTSSYFKYANTEFEGSVKNLKRLDWYIPKKKKDYVEMLDALVSGELDDKEMGLNRYYALLKDYLLQYKKIESNGGWPVIDAGIVNSNSGDKGPYVDSLVKFLTLTKDFSGTNVPGTYDNSVTDAVKSFQARMGLEITGRIDEATLAQMNVPVSDRIRQIMVNMERMRWFSPPDTAADFLMVNIPAYQLLVIEKGKLKWKMDVVVGTTANQTTVFKGMLSQVVVNPYWNVPESIIEEEMLGKLQENASGYLASQDMEVVRQGKVVDAASVDWNDESDVEKIRIRQKPGEQNSLGKYKFLFPNNFSIYLHDTPAKHLFDKNARSFSHGCIRVEEPEKLADYLLRNNSEWTARRKRELLEDGKETSIAVNPPLPVYLVYFTAWAQNDGKLQFRKDIYEHDKRLARELYEEGKISMK